MHCKKRKQLAEMEMQVQSMEVKSKKKRVKKKITDEKGENITVSE